MGDQALLNADRQVSARHEPSINLGTLALIGTLAAAACFPGKARSEMMEGVIPGGQIVASGVLSDDLSELIQNSSIRVEKIPSSVPKAKLSLEANPGARPEALIKVDIKEALLGPIRSAFRALFGHSDSSSERSGVSSDSTDSIASEDQRYEDDLTDANEASQDTSFEQEYPQAADSLRSSIRVISPVHQKIEFEVQLKPGESVKDATLFDVQGRRIASAEISPGHEQNGTFHGSIELQTSGFYFLKVQTGGEWLTAKVLVFR